MSRPTAVQLMGRWAGLIFNVHGILGLPRIARYFIDWLRYARRSSMSVPALDSYPCLADATRVTPFDAHYFFQAAWLARQLAVQRPATHVDVGSDVLAVGTISAFVETTFIDYRPLQVSVSGLHCKGGDILDLPLASNSVSSLSCLHVVEHVGLGRYGDPLNADGHIKAAAEFTRVLADGGSLFLSTPVGRERVCFNAHRVFSPQTIVRLFSELRLQEFSCVDDGGKFHENAEPQTAANFDYGCGMFHFIKAS